MRYRIGFVSNSSSSSFIIRKEFLTEDQIESIKNHMTLAKEEIANCSDDIYNLDCVDDGDAWHIEENEHLVFGYTIMDNFNMHGFLTKYLKIPNARIQWE